MNWKEYIPEIIEANKIYRAKRAEAKRYYNKYKKQVKKYAFLDVITKPKQGTERQDDIDLEIAINDLFNSIGIKSHRPSNQDNFDVISKFKNVRIGIEVKNGGLPGENEMFQAHKYKKRYESDRNETIHALVVYNNSKTNQEFDNNRIKDAELNGYGIITTRHLETGYFKLKKDRITFDIFLAQLQKIGVIKYSSKALSKSINS